MGRLATLLTKTWNEFSEDDCPSMAAALAYYTIFSLAPLLVLVVLLVSLVWDPGQVEGEVQQQMNDWFGNQGAQQVQTMMASAQQHRSGWTAVWGFVILAIGATGLFGQLQTALNRAWGVAPDPNQSGVVAYLGRRAFSLLMILLIAAVLFASLLLSAVLTAFGGQVVSLLPGEVSGALLRAIDFAVSFLVVALLFAAIFKWLPDAKIAWRDTIVGALVTALLFVIGKTAIGIYLGYVNMGSTYGAAGSLVLLLVWVYYSSMIVLLGAEFTQVWARRHGKDIEPEEGAVRVLRRTESVPNQRHAA